MKAENNRKESAAKMLAEVREERIKLEDFLKPYLENLAKLKVQEYSLTQFLEAEEKAERALVSIQPQPKAGTQEVPAEATPGKDMAGKVQGSPLKGKPLMEEARQVLLKAGKALHYLEITKIIQEAGLVISGANPAGNLLAHIARRPDIFVRIGPGVWGLKDRDEKPE